MITDIPLLSNVKVAAPCHASWNDMEAVDGDRVHFCGGCKKNVYNLSAMSQGQAEGLLRKHEGHLCVRYYQRTDGTILTQNCPVGQAALRMKMIARSKRAAVATAALAVIGSLVRTQSAVTGKISRPQTANEIDRERRETVGSVYPTSKVKDYDIVGEIPASDKQEIVPLMGVVGDPTEVPVKRIRAEAKSLGMKVPEH